jgi:hypothetical protein
MVHADHLHARRVRDLREGQEVRGVQAVTSLGLDTLQVRRVQRALDEAGAVSFSAQQ